MVLLKIGERYMQNCNSKELYLKAMGIDVWRLRRADQQPIIYSMELLDKQGICAAYLLMASNPETLEKSALELLDAMLKAIDLRRSSAIPPFRLTGTFPRKGGRDLFNKAPTRGEGIPENSSLFSARGEEVLVLIMGEKPAQYFLNTQEDIASLRCNNPHKKTICVTYDPQAVQINLQLKRPVWQDLCLFKSLCDSSESLRGGALTPK